MVYLDNAATTYPKPAPVQNSVSQALVTYGGNPGR
jgi:selenocysteine lyase/cysteine desulfurase